MKVTLEQNYSEPKEIGFVDGGRIYLKSEDGSAIKIWPEYPEPFMTCEGNYEHIKHLYLTRKTIFNTSVLTIDFGD